MFVNPSEAVGREELMPQLLGQLLVAALGFELGSSGLRHYRQGTGRPCLAMPILALTACEQVVGDQALMS